MADAGSETYEQRRVILVGKSGNGKSSTGNTILGTDAFTSKRSFQSVTQECQQHTVYRKDRDYEIITVVDTPGLFDTDQPLAQRALDIQEALEVCPNPHAFLIVLRADARYTQEDLLTIDLLRVIFGEAVLDHAILVFTRGADFESNRDFYRELNEHKEIMKLKDECKGRIVRLENDMSVDAVKRETMLKELFDMIENISNVGTTFYKYDLLDIHRRCLEEHLKNRKPETELGEELQQLVSTLGRELGTEKWRAYLIGGVAGAVGVASIGGMVVGLPAVMAGRMAAGSPAAAGLARGAMGYAGSAMRFAGTALAPAGARMFQGTMAAARAGASTLGYLARFKP